MDPKEVYFWTGGVLKSLRKSVEKLEFTEIIPAILSNRFEPGARHSVAVLGNQQLPVISKDSDESITVKGSHYFYLPVSHVVEKQMALEFNDKVYCLAPCVRLLMQGENTSGKHLYTFFQFEIEWLTKDITEVFDLGEEILSTSASFILKFTPEAYINERANKAIHSLLKRPYPKITFKEALKSIGVNPERLQDLSSDEDTLLSEKFDRPFWIYDYPEGIRDSLYHKNSKGNYDTYDLMLPFGYGELATGGIRPESGQEIIRQSKSLGKELHLGYAEWKDRTNVQSAGFGIGFERFLKFCSGSNNILGLRQFHDHGPNILIE